MKDVAFAGCFKYTLLMWINSNGNCNFTTHNNIEFFIWFASTQFHLLFLFNLSIKLLFEVFESLSNHVSATDDCLRICLELRLPMIQQLYCAICMWFNCTKNIMCRSNARDTKNDFCCLLEIGIITNCLKLVWFSWNV